MNNENSSSDFYSLIKPYLKRDIDLKKKTFLIVNVNPFDGDDGHKYFEKLTKINKSYKAKGLEIFCFPCFQFGNNGCREDVVKFMKDSNYDIGEIMDEITVNGVDTPELYKFLKRSQPGPLRGIISQNFTVIIVDSRGRPFARCGKQYFSEVEHILYQLL